MVIHTILDHPAWAIRTALEIVPSWRWGVRSSDRAGQYIRGIPSRDPHTPVRNLYDLEPRDRALRIALSVARMVLVVAAMIVAYVLLPVHDTALFPSWISVIVTVLTLAGVAVYEFWVIVRSDFPTLREMQAITFIVSVAVVGFAAVYASVASYDTAAFSEPLDRVGALYLSVATASTVGFGDIHARSDAARIVVMLQIVTTVGLVGVAIQMIRRAAARRSAGAER